MHAIVSYKAEQLGKINTQDQACVLRNRVKMCKTGGGGV